MSPLNHSVFPLILICLVHSGQSSMADEWWSLQRLIRPSVPGSEDSDAARARTPVDRFVIARHREKGLTLAPEADRRTLIRRLYFNLTGLPPSPDTIKNFIADRHPNAYEKLVDRLLASPGYGERWARHWLDIVHYGESHGYDKDKPRPNAYPYRDYVIRAFNQDKPYQRFIKEQLAGDVLWPDTVDGIVATGFIAAGPWDFIGHAEVSEEKIDGKIARHLDRDDMITATLNTFCSLTVQCAQCHDHKRDPVTMKDYYALQAVFAALDRADRDYDPDPDIAKRRAVLGKDIARVEAAIEGVQTAIEPHESEEVQRVDTASRKAVPEAMADFDDYHRELTGLKADSATLRPPEKVYTGTVHTGSGAFKGRGHVDGKPREIFLLTRGDVTMPGKAMEPGAVPGIVPGLPSRFDLPIGHDEGDRRIALAEWIAHPQNVLTWRSIANRVWHYHFGRGIVDTPNDFGRMGGRPSHPALLDWLAVEFRDSGGSIKHLHRLILNSAIYKQRSVHDAAQARIDASNTYLWRQNRRHLEAEAIRDTVLFVAGKLDLEMYGKSFMDFVIDKPEHSPHYEYHKADPNDPSTHRRTVYRFIIRSQPQPLMEALDCADPSQLVDSRGETNTALQALAMLNNRFMVRMAEHFGERLLADGVEPVTHAFELALSRRPTDTERKRMQAYANEYGLSAMARLIFNMNEFSFVD